MLFSNVKFAITAFLLVLSASASAQDTTTVDKMKQTQQLQDVVVSTRKPGTRRLAGAENTMLVSRDELFKAACCNLGESFITNPSIDVNFSDAATGARQIKLLGLNGNYVQLLTENQPAYRGAALPYRLSYIPGIWMKSIQISKGNASVKNGYEPIAGQINVEYLKPDDPTGGMVNVYGNTMDQLQADAEANFHIGGSKNLSTELLAHFENKWGHHDSNDDGFQDDPNVLQYNLQSRWYAKKGRYMFHGGLELIHEKRDGGQSTTRYNTTDPDRPLYRIGVQTDHYGAYMKHAIITDKAHGGNLALMGKASMHRQDSHYGLRSYDINEKNINAQLMYETTLDRHNLFSGLSLNYDYFHEGYYTPSATQPLATHITSETTPGAYFQYTYNYNNSLIAMAGVRVDHSNMYGTFVTPRFHLKWAPTSIWTLRLSAGKGYRSPHPLAENSFRLASGKALNMEKPEQEQAWTYGISSDWFIPVAGKTLKIDADYYYTDFSRQYIIEDNLLNMYNLDGRSYSHTLEVDVSYPLVRGLELTAAYRYNLAKTTYRQTGRQELPLQSRNKALFTASYKTPLGLWEADATFVLYGSGRMTWKDETSDDSWIRRGRYKPYTSLQAQITRNFRHFSIYVGGENLTGFKQKNPIIDANNPWSSNVFDMTRLYGPISGVKGYIGIRIKFGNRY